MKINHNMSAIVANKKLLRTENTLSNSIERLSTGLRINRASDDAAGMAIASKMTAQIKGLGQASRNASDGVSVLETTDGALNEVHNMLQRMRELSVQAANGTNTPDDLKAIQLEIGSLRDEIDRVSKDTEFNTKPLLDGTLDQRVYPDNRGVTRIDISDAVSENTYSVQINADATHAVIRGGANLTETSVVPAGAAGSVIINGVEVKIEEGETFDAVYEKLRAGAELGEVNLMVVRNLNDTSGTPENGFFVPSDLATGGNLVFVSDEYGQSAEMNVKCDNPTLAAFLGIQSESQANGTDVQVDIAADDEGFGTQATILTDGNYVTITDRGGFEMKFEVIPGEITPGDTVNLDVTGVGPMTLQIGANENQTMDVRIQEISSQTLYIDKVNVCTVTGASRAITSFDGAIAKVSEVRSSIGAYMNRLDYAVNSLDLTEENMTQALSRIEDVDMAEEMTEYTKYNILSQAATSVLAQANDLPQQVLQLLQ
ncbi:MAG: flagellin [Lachnospiraceae bacterium]|nr:flagellin [Lachnospiraceae bacterium]